MYSGSCLCGKVSYEYRGEIEEVSMCHCSLCQKAQGSAFVAVCPVESKDLSFCGQQFIKEYSASEGKVRAFCGECGSALYSAKHTTPEVKRLRLGTLDQAVKPGYRYHKFVASKATWFEINDGLPQFEANHF